MPVLANLQEQHERFVARYPVPPPEPTGSWTFIPDPLEQRRSLLKLVASILRGLAGRWRR